MPIARALRRSTDTLVLRAILDSVAVHTTANKRAPRNICPLVAIGCDPGQHDSLIVLNGDDPGQNESLIALN